MINRQYNHFRDLPLGDTHLHPVEMRPLSDSFMAFRDITDYFE